MAATPRTTLYESKPGPTTLASDKISETKDRELLTQADIRLKPQQVPIWSAAKPESILLYRPAKGDDILNLRQKITEYGRWYEGDSELCAITTVDRHPKPLEEWTEGDFRGLSVVLIPRGLLNLRVEVKQKNRYLEYESKKIVKIAVNQWMRVKALKELIERKEGIPVAQQDLLYQNRCLQNENRLHIYNLNENNTVELVIQPRYDLSVTVQAFWGQDYNLQIERCIKVRDIIGYVLWHLFVDKSSRETRYLVNSLLRQDLFSVEYQSNLLPVDEGLNMFKPLNASFLRIWPYFKDSDQMTQTIDIDVEFEGRRLLQVPASPSDTWGIVALKVYKLMRVPLDRMRLKTDAGVMDFDVSVGFGKANKHHAKLEVGRDFERDVYEWHHLHVRYPSGVLQTVHFNHKDTVSDFKQYLACMGFYLAKYYTMFSGQIPLNDSSVITRIKQLKPGNIVDLELEVFPLYVHLRGQEFVVLEEHQLTSLANLRLNIYSTLETLEIENNALVHCGQVLSDFSTPLYKTNIGPNSVFFIERVPDYTAMEFIIGDPWARFHITLPRPARGEIIWDSVKNCKYLYDNSKYAVVLLLNWLLTPRTKKEEDDFIISTTPRQRPRREEPIKPRQYFTKVWKEFVEKPQPKKPKKKQDSQSLPPIEENPTQPKEWPFETAQPRRVRFPAIPPPTASSSRTKRTKVKFKDADGEEIDEKRAQYLVDRQAKAMKKKTYDKKIQCDMTKRDRQAARIAKKKAMLEDTGEYKHRFSSREAREAWEKAKAEEEEKERREAEEKTAAGEEPEVKERDKDSTGRVLPQLEGKPEERKLPDADEPRKRRPPPGGKPVEDDEPAPSEKPSQKEEKKETEEEEEDSPSLGYLPRKSVGAEELLELQKQLRERRKTIGSVVHTSELTKDVGKEYEVNDKAVADRCTYTGDDDQTTFARLLFPRKARAEIIEPLPDGDQQPKVAPKILKTKKQVAFEDEKKNGYWKPILQAVNYFDDPIWEYRPTFQEEMELKEKYIKEVEAEVEAEELEEEEREKEELERSKKRPKKKVEDKENKANFDLVSSSQGSATSGGRYQPSRGSFDQAGVITEQEGENVTLSADNVQMSRYKREKEYEKRELMDVEARRRYEHQQRWKKPDGQKKPNSNERDGGDKTSNSDTGGKDASTGGQTPVEKDTPDDTAEGGAKN